MWNKHCKQHIKTAPLCTYCTHAHTPYSKAASSEQWRMFDLDKVHNYDYADADARAERR